MAFAKKTNGCRTELSFDVAAAAASMTVADATDLPDISGGGYYYLTIWDTAQGSHPGADAGMEIVKVTAAAGAVLTITRAQDGTADVDHDAGDAVELLLCKALLDEYEAVFATGVAGPTTLTLVTDLQDNSGTLEMKTTDVTVTEGIVTAIAAESAWGNVPSV